MVAPIFHDFNDSVFDGLADNWEIPFRLYSRVSETEQNHMTHSEVLLDNNAENRFLGWFMLRQVDTGKGPFAIDERGTFILRVNSNNYPISNTFMVGDKLMSIVDNKIYRIVSKAIYSKWSGVNRFICEEFP